MDWSQYRTAHLTQYGPTTRQQLSKDYQVYKKSLTSKPSIKKSPNVQKSPKLKSIKPVKKPSVKKEVQKSPSILRIPKSPSKNLSVKFNDVLQVKEDRGRSPVRSKKLTLKQIEKMASDKKFLIIVLYADWCGHCQEMKQKLGNKMKDTEKIIFVESNKMDDSLKDYFPHVMYYENGKRQKDLNVENVYEYLNI